MGGRDLYPSLSVEGENAWGLCHNRLAPTLGNGSTGRGQPLLTRRFDIEGIAVHATAPAPPPSLLAQLSVGGILVCPVAERRADMLTAFRRLAQDVDPESGAGFERRPIAPCRFVPLIGDEGFAAD